MVGTRIAEDDAELGAGKDSGPVELVVTADEAEDAEDELEMVGTGFAEDEAELGTGSGTGSTEELETAELELDGMGKPGGGPAELEADKVKAAELGIEVVLTDNVEVAAGTAATKPSDDDALALKLEVAGKPAALIVDDALEDATGASDELDCKTKTGSGEAVVVAVAEEEDAATTMLLDVEATEDPLDARTNTLARCDAALVVACAPAGMNTLLRTDCAPGVSCTQTDASLIPLGAGS